MDKFWLAAEKMFSIACTDADITCNKSSEDQQGWDFILDVIPPKDTTQLLSSQQTLRQTLVQIKSTIKGKTTCPMKLSNALNLAKVSKPCYVVLYSKIQNEIKIYLKHIWENEIYAIHKKATEYEAKGLVEFHKVNYTLRFNDDELIEGNVAEAIKQHQRSLAEEYPSIKTKIATAVGYENGSGTGEITLELESEDDFVKMMLGLKKDVSCPKFTMTPSRFGIQIPHLSKELVRAKISVEPEYYLSKIRIRSENFKPLFFDVKTSNVHIRNSNSDTMAVRIDIAGISLIFSTNLEIQESSFNVDREESKYLNDLIFICGCFMGKKIDLDLMVENEWKHLAKLSCETNLNKIGFSMLIKYLIWLKQIETEYIGNALIKFSVFELSDIFKQLHEAYILGNHDGASYVINNDISYLAVEIHTLIRPVFIFTESQLIVLIAKSRITNIMKEKIFVEKFNLENIRIFHGESKIEKSLNWYDTELKKFHGEVGIMYMRPTNDD